jgi:ribokinase
MTGEDVFAQMLRAFYKKEKLHTTLSKSSTAQTGLAFIAVDETGENSIYANNGANDELSPWDLRAVVPRRSDIVSATLETPTKTLRYIFYKAKKAGATTVLNAAPMMPGVRQLLPHVDYCIVNETEFSEFTGKRVTSAPTAIYALRSLRVDGRNIVVTLGKSGAVALIHGEILVQKAFPAKPVDTTGAGDCFVGAFVTRLKETGDAKEAMRFAAAAAALSVEREGASASMPKRAEINTLLAKHKNL